jgi:hypothetical protein
MMMRYAPRALWYVAVVLVGLLALYFPTKLLVNGYLSAASTYLPLSLLFVFFSRFWRKGGNVHDAIFGVPILIASLFMMALGLVLCVAYSFTDYVFFAQFGVIFIFIGVDIALTLREDRVGQRSERGTS